MATKHDPEIAAISHVYAALRELQPDSQQRVLDYVARKLGLERVSPEQSLVAVASEQASPASSDESIGATEAPGAISPVAKKWMGRNGLSSEKLSKLFSIDGDEIDVIARTLPGKKKVERMRQVFLLQGIAAYLGSGAARFTHEKVKEACLHYDAYDAAHFARDVGNLSGEINGTKDSGYALTARGLAAATSLVQQLVP
jgi:hypothetical protein